jgi:predicted NBD/HSP70 family sugar kinase
MRSGLPSIIDSPALVRRINRGRVLRALREHGTLTRPEVVEATGLSKATVREVCDDLVRTEVLQELGPDPSEPRGPGRPPRHLRFRPGLGFVLGIDVGADKILVLAADLGGRELASRSITAAGGEQPTRERVLGQLVGLAEDVAAEAASAGGPLRAAVVGTPGVVEPVSGRVSLAPQIAGWSDRSLAEPLVDALGCPVVAENEVHLAVVGERWRGAASDMDAAVYLNLGIGIGAGIVIGGELLRGADGGAGEVGYLPVETDEPAPEGVGSFEWAAGGSAFARAGRAAAQTVEGARLAALADGDADAVDARIVCAAAAEGDRCAASIVDALAERLARGIAAIACVVNPPVVVVGGGLSNAGPVLLEPIRERLADLVPLPPRLVPSQLGERAVAIGALSRALDLAHAEIEAS